MNKRQLRYFNLKTNSDYELSHAVLEGQDHIIVPVVMLVEGVFQAANSEFATYYPAESLQHLPDKWNGSPLTLGHPRDVSGNFVSANSPDIHENWVIGNIWNTRFEDGKLKADAWINTEKINNLNPEFKAKVENREQIEISTGVWLETVEEEGEFNNRQFQERVVNMYPDHLAMLNEMQGACNWQDGCGVRANQEGEENMKQGKKGATALLQGLFTNFLKNEGFDISELKSNQEGCGCEKINVVNVSKEDNPYIVRVDNTLLEDNQGGLVELVESIRMKLDQMDTESRIHFLEEVFEDSFVFKIRDTITGSVSLFMQEYNVNEETGEVEFTGEATPVRKEIEFVEIQTNQKENKNNQEGLDMNRKEKIDELLNKELFTNEDREKLEQMDEWTFEQVYNSKTKAHQLEAGNGEAEREEEETPGESKTGEDTPTPEGNEKKEVPSFDEVLNSAPKEYQEMIRIGINEHNKKKDNLIEAIKANKRNKFTDEQLKEKGIEELEALASLGQVDVDYSLQAGSDYGSSQEEDTPQPTSLRERREQMKKGKAANA